VGRVLGSDQVGEDAEVVAGPDAVPRLVEVIDEQSGRLAARAELGAAAPGWSYRGGTFGP
jgi:hypothetical protein